MSNVGSRHGGIVDGGPDDSPLSRYDLLLAVIPLAFVAALLVGRLAAVPTHLAVGTGASVGALALADALFVNPPR